MSDGIVEGTGGRIERRDDVFLSANPEGTIARAPSTKVFTDISYHKM